MHPSDLNPPNVQYNSDPAPFGSFLNHIHHPRHMRVILIGAELAGLCFAYKLQRSFEDYGLDFPGVYATGEEVPGYFNTFAKNHSLEKFMKTEHKVRKGEWQGQEGAWHVEIENLYNGCIITMFVTY